MKRTSLILGAARGTGCWQVRRRPLCGFHVLKISPILGEITHDGDPGWIEIESYQWLAGAPNLSSLQPGARAKGGPGVFQFSHRPGASSPLLQRAFNSKQRFAKVQLDIPKPGAEVNYYTITLTDATISSFSKGTSGFPTETIKMTYGAIEWTYSEQRPASLQTAPGVKK